MSSVNKATSSTISEDEEEIEEEVLSISEDISISSNLESGSKSNILSNNNRNKLFGINDDDDDDDDEDLLNDFKLFDSKLDAELDDGHIASHFTITDDVDTAARQFLHPDLNKPSVSDLSSGSELDKNVNIRSSAYATTTKDLSPFKEDVILINNNKVSLKALENIQTDEPLSLLDELTILNNSAPKVSTKATEILRKHITSENQMSHTAAKEIVSETIKNLPSELFKTEPNASVQSKNKDESSSSSLDNNKDLSVNITQSEGNQISSNVAEPIVAPTNNSFESVVSLNMLNSYENKLKELEEIVAGKQICINSLNTHLDTSYRHDSLKDSAPSALDSYSLATSSTEYRTYHDDLNKACDFQHEILCREKLIEQLTESLQQSMQIREDLQDQGEKLSAEVLNLRKQLNETINAIKKPQLQNEPQIINSKANNQDQGAPHSNDKITSGDTSNGGEKNVFEQITIQLAPDEMEIFSRIQGHFQKYLNEEIGKMTNKYDNEVKLIKDQLEFEKQDKETETNRLRQLLANSKSGSPEITELRRELEVVHEREMEKLRTYFEQKCADLGKHYSDEIFSEHSRRHSHDSGSELSDDQDHLQEDKPCSLQSSPKHKSKFDILASPTHRKLTPTSISSPNVAHTDQDPEPTYEELNSFYREKIANINKKHEDVVKTLQMKLKKYETHDPDDEYQPKYDETQKDITNNDSHMLNEIIREYDVRLKEQVDLAKTDIICALDEQIQALLSDSIPDDSKWPPELILLREKFTAKSQLEIAQLQIKHKTEMENLRHEFELQSQRKMKRQTTFDGNRDLNEIVLERDNLRELCSSFRWLLSELAKCVSFCEEDMNNVLFDELQKHGITITNQQLLEDMDESIHSIQSPTSKHRASFVPNVSGIISLVEDPVLVGYVSENKENSFNLNDCVDKLKNEAICLLKLSEELCKKNSSNISSRNLENDDSCGEEDGLKSQLTTKNKIIESGSLKENIGGGALQKMVDVERRSLPTYMNTIALGTNAIVLNSDLCAQLNDYKNRLSLSETERKNLMAELSETIKKHDNLAQILCIAKEHLEAQREDISEGYGISQLKSPSRQVTDTKTAYSDLQCMAKTILNTTPNTADSDVLQKVEEFCAKLDRFMEDEERNKNDLQEQISAADKQNKTKERLLEQQAKEWQDERDMTTKETERLTSMLKEKEKECYSLQQMVKEVDAMDQHIKEMQVTIELGENKQQKLETELKASIDKVFDLRDIIAELEKQVHDKSTNEHVLAEKLKSLEIYVSDENYKSKSIHEEFESIKNQFQEDYNKKIEGLEAQVKELRPNAEQTVALNLIKNQLKEIETLLVKKTKNLEILHSDICSASCSSPSEDVSINNSAHSPVESPRDQTTIPVDDVQRIMEKLIKHNRAEEAAIKRMRDLEMQINTCRISYDELHNERDELQEKLSEQILRITTLQTRLDEQRHRTDEILRQGTSDLNLKVYDLQSQVTNLQEKLSSRDKQIATLKDHLEKSKVIIDQLEKECSNFDSKQNDNHLLDELKLENSQLKDKIRNEMINKLALPDLMETMLSEKNEEIDHLKEQLQSFKVNRLDACEFKIDEKGDSERNEDLGKLSARTLSDIVSLTEFDDQPDIIRKTSENYDNDAAVLRVPMESSQYFAGYTKSNIPHIQTDAGDTSVKSKSSKSDSHLLDLPTRPEVEDELKDLRNMLDRSTVELRQQVECNNSLKLDLIAKDKLLASIREEKKAIQDELDHLKVESLKLNNMCLEIETLQMQLDNKTKDYTNLKILLNEKTEELNKLETKLEDAKQKTDILQVQIVSLNKTISHKDELLLRIENNCKKLTQNEAELLQKITKLEEVTCDTSQSRDENKRLQQELTRTKNELFEKMIAYEKSQLDLQEHPMASTGERLNAELERNKILENEVFILKNALQGYENNKKSFILDEIAASVEEELHYSAQLDSNILKAFESSDEKNSDEDNYIDGQQPPEGQEQSAAEFNAVKEKYEIERINCQRLQALLETEKKNSNSIQEHDANIIEAMRVRLEATLNQELELQKMLDQERSKCEKLSSQILTYQKTIAKDSATLLSSPQNSPRMNRLNNIESELVNSLKSDIKLLTSKNERERERIQDIEQTMNREKLRMEKEICDQKDYGDRLKCEMDRILKENQALAINLEHTQEKLAVSIREVDHLQRRLSNLQEAESRRAIRRGKEKSQIANQGDVDLHEMRQKLGNVERERDELEEKVAILRGEIERGANREAKLAEALLTEQSGEGIVPQKFLEKLTYIADNTKEYAHIAETLQLLTDERRALQRRVNELETNNNSYSKTELEQRANHLFGKYLRVESFRKALVHQKRYLVLMLNTYQENESKALALLNGSPPKRKIKFRSAVLVVIALQRMKYIVKRWQIGKRIGGEAVFSTKYT